MGRKRASQSAPDSGSITGEYEISTGCAQIEPDPFRPNAFVLKINGVPSSHLVLGQPRELEFEYMRWIAAVVEQLSPGQKLLHLGGGGCTLPRYFADLWPESHNVVVELDAQLAQLVRTHFEVPKAPHVKIRVGEARAETCSFPASRFDVVIRDVFAGAITPAPLTTVEYFAQVRRILTPGGIFVANCGDHSDLRLAKAELASLQQVFSNVAVIADPPMLKGRRYGNIILIAADAALPHEDTPAAQALAKPLLAGAVPAHYKDPAWTKQFTGGAVQRYDAEI